MILQKKTLEKLRDLITHETEYRGGPKLIAFFNSLLGTTERYEQGFPSRWIYVDQKLEGINGTPYLDTCIKNLFSPVNFIGSLPRLDSLISDFNQYMAFDNWKVVRNNKEISFEKVDHIDLPNQSQVTTLEDEFLKREFEGISIDGLTLDTPVIQVITSRFDEIKRCLGANAPLSVIFLSGSCLEGILLGIASQNPKLFNKSLAAPKDKEGKVLQLHQWTLSNFIDVAHEVGYIKEDVKKFSHSLRDFRNYIHPFQQLSSNFQPDEHTAKLCWQVLRTAIFQISRSISQPNPQ